MILSLKNITPIDQSSKFGYLVIQDADGRMKPVNTFASEILRKLFIWQKTLMQKLYCRLGFFVNARKKSTVGIMFQLYI